jgi:hypothetical protein
MEWLVFELEEMKRHLASGIKADVQHDVREITAPRFHQPAKSTMTLWASTDGLMQIRACHMAWLKAGY